MKHLQEDLDVQLSSNTALKTPFPNFFLIYLKSTPLLGTILDSFIQLLSPHLMWCQLRCRYKQLQLHWYQIGMLVHTLRSILSMFGGISFERWGIMAILCQKDPCETRNNKFDQTKYHPAIKAHVVACWQLVPLFHVSVSSLYLRQASGRSNVFGVSVRKFLIMSISSEGHMRQI